MNVVERQLKAYNEKDIDAFMACYSEDVHVYAFPNIVRMSSNEEMRVHYKKLFDTYPNMNAEIVKRIEQHPYVIDHEKITGRKEEPFHATAIYEIKDDIITKVWFL
ncbi:nuclear transport factor 2 family protein [Bacillus sp. 31A1R]|uniref:Nuclear transport factor 2 family protein n=1 Tax=Robertmurraya mangrovi TaxID=3098077 RepID=A0ABU5J3J2_9BACI|nr:nuclear transport factor 2 family protein [Bacillus sp. 31A1R]MDZ5473973.1 nuclear transport factor 2 family protein [Bacillus sp. 31A1R]